GVGGSLAGSGDAGENAGETGQAGDSGVGGSNSGGTGGTGALPAGQGVGEGCSTDERCRPGLDCLDAHCTPNGSTPAGMPCVIQGECSAGLQCIGGRCAAGGDGVAGDPCLLDSACTAGLRCTFAGLAAVCGPQGDGDTSAPCEVSSDCYQGLACAAGKCAPQPPGIPVFTGVECDPPSSQNVTAYFEVPGADDADEGDFFRLPFPNDVRRSSGGLDLSGFPTPGPGAIGVDAVKLYVDALEANDDGWGAYPTAFFRFSGPLDAATVGNTGSGPPLAWIDVTPNVAEPWASVGLSWFYSSGANSYICDNWIGARRPRGVPLEPGHTYAVYVTTQLRACAETATDGSCTTNAAILQPKNLASLLGSSVPKDAKLAEAYDKYQPLRAYLMASHIEVATILDATVFTVGGVRDTMAAVADKVADLDPPQVVPGSWTKCDDGVASPCPDHAGLRACGGGTKDYDEYHALVKLPIFQQGQAPYLTPADGGAIAVDAAAPPTEDVCLSLTVPKDDSMPADGWPLVVYAHGTGGSFRDHVNDSVAGALSSGSVKFAVLGIDQVEHGPRRGGSDQSPDNLFFNFTNPAAARGNPIQGAADQLSLARLAAEIDGSGDNPTKLDASELFFFGHSQGATEGSLMLPYADGFRAAVLSGNGASLMNALLTKSKPVDVKSLLPIALSDLSATGDAGEYHPVLSLLQEWIDPSDPLNFARAVAREPLEGHAGKHLFQTYGKGDSYAPAVTLATYARAGGLTLVNPVVQDTTGAPFYVELTTADAPLSGNAAGNVTAGVRQYTPPSGVDGHFVVFDTPEANADMVRFFSQAVSGVPSIGE
ncbi:MAG TPA: hypothetical protein VGQ57_01090, partial [Polyangiaceae bacterium]|nr:hypothetical protein [Polyangiaceae bacterium]